MGKKKQIRNLELEVDRLRKNVIDREVAIDKLLSDTITDSEKNVIKHERQFAKLVQKEFDRNLLSGKTQDYSTVSKVCDFYDNMKRNPNNISNISEGFKDLLTDEVKVYHRPINHPDNIQTQGRQYRHTEEADKLYVEFSINHGDKFAKEVEYNADGVIKTKITYTDAESAPKTMAEIHDDINLMEIIVKMPGCNLSDKEEIERLRKENEEFRLNAKKSIDLSFQQLKGHIAEKDEMKSCIFTLSQENENLRMEVERLNKLIDRAQKGEKRDEMNLEMGQKFINEVIQEANHIKAHEQNSRISKMVNDFTANELKDVETYNEKYIFLSDYQLPSLYINQDIVIKEGTIISLLEGGSYGIDAVSLIRFPYQNIKMFEEKGLVRRLSPLEICGEPQVCAPAKEDQECIDVKDLNSMDGISSFITLCDTNCLFQGEKKGFTIPKFTSFVKDDHNDYKSINGSLMIHKEVMLEHWVNNKVSVQYN